MRKYNSIQKSCGWPGVYNVLKKNAGEKDADRIFGKADVLLTGYKTKYKEVKGIAKIHISAAYTVAASAPLRIIHSLWASERRNDPSQFAVFYVFI